MSNSKVKYAYVPENSFDDMYEACTLEELVEVLDTCKEDPSYKVSVKMINNINDGIIMNENISQIVEYCTEKELNDKVSEAVNSRINCLIINGFNITLDKAREVYCAVAAKKDMYIYINVYSDKYDEMMYVYLDSDAHKLSKAEWDKQKTEIHKEIISCQEGKDEEEEDEEVPEVAPRKMTVSEYVEQLSKAIKQREKQEPETDIEVIETYSHMTKNSEINVSLTDQGDVLLGDDVFDIIIPEKSVNFVYEILGKFINKGKQ